jgi:PHD/YefM family antitoxin component YafN of YafNO toxin-antitoxin module
MKTQPQFITNTDGEKVSVIIPLSDYYEMLEDLEDLAAIAQLRNEETIPWEQVKKELQDNDLL